VAEETISQYHRSFKLLPQTLQLADEGSVIGNANKFEIIAQKKGKRFAINRALPGFLEDLLRVLVTGH
jgi:hypothetical protein